MQHPADRPTALDIVNKCEIEWRRWRAETTEGRRVVDVEDARVLRTALGPNPPALGLLGGL